MQVKVFTINVTDYLLYCPFWRQNLVEDISNSILDFNKKLYDQLQSPAHSLYTQQINPQLVGNTQGQYWG